MQGFASGFAPAFGVDPLSGFFLAALALRRSGRCLRPGRSAGVRPARAVGALSGAFLLSLVGVVAARDVTSFLAFWELMTLVPATAILVARRDAQARHAVFVYLAIAHLGGAGVWVSMLMLADHGALGGAAPRARRVR